LTKQSLKNLALLCKEAELKNEYIECISRLPDKEVSEILNFNDILNILDEFVNYASLDKLYDIV
jgi:translation initiation factor RLI1